MMPNTETMNRLIAKRIGFYQPDSVTVTTGMLNTLFGMACENEHRSVDEQAALIVAAQLLEAAGIPGGVEHAEHSCREIEVEW